MDQRILLNTPRPLAPNPIPISVDAMRPQVPEASLYCGSSSMTGSLVPVDTGAPIKEHRPLPATFKEAPQPRCPPVPHAKAHGVGEHGPVDFTNIFHSGEFSSGLDKEGVFHLSQPSKLNFLDNVIPARDYVPNDNAKLERNADQYTNMDDNPLLRERCLPEHALPPSPSINNNLVSTRSDPELIPTPSSACGIMPAERNVYSNPPMPSESTSNCANARLHGGINTTPLEVTPKSLHSSPLNKFPCGARSAPSVRPSPAFSPANDSPNLLRCGGHNCSSSPPTACPQSVYGPEIIELLVAQNQQLQLLQAQVKSLIEGASGQVMSRNSPSVRAIGTQTSCFDADAEKPKDSQACVSSHEPVGQHSKKITALPASHPRATSHSNPSFSDNVLQGLAPPSKSVDLWPKIHQGMEMILQQMENKHQSEEMSPGYKPVNSIESCSRTHDSSEIDKAGVHASGSSRESLQSLEDSATSRVGPDDDSSNEIPEHLQAMLDRLKHLGVSFIDVQELQGQHKSGIKGTDHDLLNSLYLPKASATADVTANNSSDLSVLFNSYALKYLTEDQLSQLAESHRKTKRSGAKSESESNYLSMATNDFLRRYGMLDRSKQYTFPK